MVVRVLDGTGTAPGIWAGLCGQKPDRQFRLTGFGSQTCGKGLDDVSKDVRMSLRNHPTTDGLCCYCGVTNGSQARNTWLQLAISLKAEVA